MKTDRLPSPAPRRVLPYVIAYLCWLVSIAACVAAVLQLRSAVNVLWVAAGGARSSLGLANQVTLLSGSLAAFVYIMFLEGYYRDGARPGAGRASLLRRFAITLAVPVGVFALSLALVELALRSIR